MKAIHVGIWEGSTETGTSCEFKLRASCEFNPETKDVTDIEPVEVDGLIDILKDEFIELPDGTIVRDYTIDGKKLNEE